MLDITSIIESVIALLAVVITSVVIPYIKAKTTAQQQKEVFAWVRIAVAAAEQIYKGIGRGEEKKNYVLYWLKKHGLTVDAKQLDTMIEAAVFDISNSFLTIRESVDNADEDGEEDKNDEDANGSRSFVSCSQG